MNRDRTDIIASKGSIEKFCLGAVAADHDDAMGLNRFRKLEDIVRQNGN
jgi:hypothetical protein